MKLVLYTIACLLWVLLPSLNARAQGENNFWFFGPNHGINFNTSPPSMYPSNMQVLEGSAAVSDEFGQLLFYSSGGAIWDRNGNVMPNAQGLLGNGPAPTNPQYPYNSGSSASGVLIVKSPSNPNQYYQIVTDANEDFSFKAYYSVIDMTLNSGLGDVVPTQKNIVFATDVAEGVKGIVGEDCNTYWALLKRQSTNELLTFKIDETGISSTPVISPAITTGMGNVVFDPDGNRMGDGSD